MNTPTASTRARWLPAIAATALLVLLALVPYGFEVYWQQLGFRALQLLTLALAWNLLAGYGGQVSLGTGAFVGLGAYAYALIGNRWHLPLVALLPLCGGVAAVFATLVSPALFRLRGLYFTIGTLALAEALRILMVNLPQFGGANGIVLQSESLRFYQMYWLALVVALVAALIMFVLLRSPASLSLRAVRDDEAVAAEMGVRVFRVKLGCFALSAFLMGVAGGLQALKLGVIEPFGSFGMSWTIDTVAIVVIGGMGTALGPLVGTIIYVLLGELLRGQPELHGALTGLFLLLVIRFSPRGLWPALQQWQGRRTPEPLVSDE
jgi:branched-chain amino acid transport system permease protein